MSAAPQSSARLFDRVLERVGVDARMYRALLSSYLVMDFRNQQFGRSTATGGAKEILTPLFTVTGQNLLIGLFASVAMFARVDAYFFALGALTVSSIVTASSVIVEFNEIVIDPEDLNVIGHLPLPVRTYSAARTTNLLMYVLLTVAALNFFPAIVGTGLRDSGWWFFPLYWIAALAANLIVAGCVILVYNLIVGENPASQLREMMAWVQVVAMLVLGYGAQMIIRDPHQSLQMLAYEFPEWICMTPPGWLAMMVAGSDALQPVIRWGILAASVVSVVAIWAVVVSRLSSSYAKMEGGGTAWGVALPALPKPGELGGWFVRKLTRPGEERSAYWLCKTFLRRDYNLKMRCWTSQAMVVAAVAMGSLTGKLADPLTTPDSRCLLTLACVYLIAMPLPQMFHNLNFSKDHQASWVLSISPIEDAAAFAAGLRKAILWHFMVPMQIFLFAVLLFLWRDFGHALLHTFAAALTVQGVAYASSVGALRAVPFSAPLARGESFGPIALFATACGVVTAGLGALHFAAVQVPNGLIWYFTFLIFLVIATERITTQILARRTVQRISV